MESRKGVLILLILTTASVLCAKGRIDGNSYAAVMGVIYSIYAWTSHKIEIAAINKNPVNTVVVATEAVITSESQRAQR